MHDRHSCTNTFTSERQCTWAARAMRAYTMSFCYVQRLHRIITSEQLVSPHHSAREMIEVMKNRDFTKLFQKSVRKVQFYHCCLIICLISLLLRRSGQCFRFISNFWRYINCQLQFNLQLAIPRNRIVLTSQ